MATGFLPFITDKSSEETIFKAILQRSKGSSYTAITNLFSVVIGLGVSAVRKKIDSYPDNLTTSAKIQELVSDNTPLHIKKDTLLFWSSVLKLERTNGEDHPIFSKDEIEIFFTVVMVNKPENLASAGFTFDQTKYEAFSDDNFNDVVSSLSGVKITAKDSERVGFTSWEEFKAYMAYNSQNNTAIKIMPVFINKKITNIEKSDYENSHCSAPYNWN